MKIKLESHPTNGENATDETPDEVAKRAQWLLDAIASALVECDIHTLKIETPLSPRSWRVVDMDNPQDSP